MHMVRVVNEARRARGGGSTVQPKRAVVRDLSGIESSIEVDFDARTAYDFAISLTIGTGEDSDLLPEDARWLKESRDSLGIVAADLESCFGDKAKGVFHGLTAAVVERPELRDAVSVVSYIEAATTSQLTRHVLAEAVRDDPSRDLVDRIVDGDADAIAELEPRLPEYNRVELVEYLRDPGPSIERMRSALGGWLPLYQRVEGRVARMLERDITIRRGDRATLDAGSLIERTTGGLRWLPDGRVRRVVMAPSYFARPYNYIFQGASWRVFCYPVADSALGSPDSATPPQAVVRLFRALGDPTRLRILKLLGERDHYLTELATQLELSKPTMKHHLALLRAAGLVTVTEEGSLTYYSIRRERLDEAGVDLRRFLS
jgi:DNA-binding transcriptional ArsR family regulator